MYGGTVAQGIMRLQNTILSSYQIILCSTLMSNYFVRTETLVSCCGDDAADPIHKHLNPCGDESQCIGVVMEISGYHRQLHRTVRFYS